MRLRSSVIGTRLGRRLLFLFLLCALLPSASVAVVSFLEVSAELRHQSEVRLRRTTKGLGLAVHERLLSLEEGVKLVGDTLTEGGGGRAPEAWLERRFEAVWSLADAGTAKLQLGSDPLGPPALGPAERAAARRGETVITLDLRREQPAVVLATRGSAPDAIVVASARSSFLFDLTETSSLPPDHDYCIFAASGERLDCSFRDAAALEAAAQALNGPSGFFEWPADEPEHLAAFWALFLDGPFHADNWTFVVSREKASVYGPLAEYRQSFPPFIVAVLCLVALVSISQLRRSLGPLEALREATERVAARDFDARVTIHSRDEFGDVADSFNTMAQRLRLAFDALESLATSERNLRQQAEEAGRAKTQFLANMSHEIRTPMTAIVGFADLLQDGEQGEPERREHVETIRRNGRHLLRIINDILDLSKVESGELDIERTPCSPADLLRKVAALVEPLARARGLDLSVEFPAPIPRTIDSDPTRLQQILTNLAQNAVKFTASGSVRLSCTTSEDPLAGGRRLRFDVIDTGPGIPAESQARMFEPFAQADSSSTRLHGGTGLGLAIAHELALLIGGTLELESGAQGSHFSLVLPLGPVHASEWIEPDREVDASRIESVPAGDIRPMSGRVLCAEDGLDNQRLIGLILRKAGLDVEIVENGQEALERLRAARESGAPFDLVLMDMQMPVMDGYVATRSLRREGWTLPIIALTAHAMSGERERCLAGGCDDYASKPIDRVKLLDLIRAQLAKRDDATD